MSKFFKSGFSCKIAWYVCFREVFFNVHSDANKSFDICFEDRCKK